MPNREIKKNQTGVKASVFIYDDEGNLWDDAAWNETGLEIAYRPIGGTSVVIDLENNWRNCGYGNYEVTVPEEAYQQDEAVEILGEITGGKVVGETHQVVGFSLAGHLLAAADSGETAVSRLTAAQSESAAAAAIAGAGIATPSSVWSHAQRTLTSSAAEVAAALAGSAMTVLRGDTLTVSWAGLGDLSARSKLWVTGKADKNHPDNAALFQVDESSGLLTINGETAATAANASLVVTDEDAGDVTLTIAGVETAKLGELASGAWDLQILTTAGPQTITEGTLAVTLDVTRATS